MVYMSTACSYHLSVRALAPGQQVQHAGTTQSSHSVCHDGCSHAIPFSAAESVTMTADGRFIMLDRYGAVREAVPSGKEMVLNPQPLAHLGPGRPLGAQYDAHGNLIICDAFKVWHW